jgi:hypothetical protein
MKPSLKTVFLTSMTAGLLLTATLPASASWFSNHHPRRAEVDRREHRQQERIREGVANGSLNPGEAAQLERQEHALRQQERNEVRANGGALTKSEQRQLNQEENALSHEIHQDRHN